MPEHTVFIITTDGMENASRVYDVNRVKEAIKRQSEKYGWEFVFLAANIDALETADRFGIGRERAMNFKQDKEGFERCYMAMECAVSNVRRGRRLDGGDWRKAKEKGDEKK